MDDENRKDVDNAISDVGKSIASAVKAGARAAAGDVVGAAKEVVTNLVFIKSVIAIIVVLVLVITSCAMMIGTAITATVEYLTTAFSENWNEAWEQQGEISNGNLLYLYGDGAELAANTALAQTILDFIHSLMETDSHTVDGEDASNNSLDSSIRSEDTVVTNEDYRITIDSIKDAESLTGEDGALQRRLDMIKGRVEERGAQIKADATLQYSLEGIGYAVAETVSSIIQDPILFNGMDWANSGINVDNSAFELTDIQALKIYAAYSIQRDGLIEDSDMWDLMDYCGWYMPGGDTSPLESDEDSIYNTSVYGTITKELGGNAVSAGSDATTIIDLTPPEIPSWSGTFAPQWYYEEIEQIKKSNDEIDAGSKVNTNPYFEVDSDGDIILDNFDKLSEFETYGLIDKMFTASMAQVRITRTEYHGADEYVDEALSKFTGAIRALWDDAYGAKSKSTTNGSVSRDSSGSHSYTIDTTISGRDYYLTDSNGNIVTDVVQSTGDSITFSGLSGSTTYTCRERTTIVTQTPDPTEPSTEPPSTDPDETEGEPDPTEPTEPTEPTTPPFRPIIPSDPDKPIFIPNSAEAEEYRWVYVDLGYGVTEIRRERVSDSWVSPLATTTSYQYATLDSFTTFQNAAGYEAYELSVNINVTFSPRSIDSLLYELMGLWPGSLSEVVEKDGKIYAKGYSNNDNLLLEWEDTYTDPDGNTHTIQFERQTGYQIEAYQDIILGLADEEILNLEVANLFYKNTYSAGQGIVKVAEQELEYYTSNGLYGGSRYWNMAYKNGGMQYAAPGNTPWCVIFVMCCAWQAGLIGEDAPWGEMKELGYWPIGCSWSVHEMQTSQNGTLYTSRDYRPSPGDFIYFSETMDLADLGHIGIVSSVLPDGSIEVIHGNWDNRVTKTYCSSYEIGTRFGGSTYICAYINPKYPTLLITEPVYQTISSQVQPSTMARYVNVGSDKVLIAGLPRFQESQIPTVLAALKTSYPDFYSDALQIAWNNKDMTAFTNEWNLLASNDKSEEFGKAQMAIYSSKFATPIINQVMTECGFDWTKTVIRENMLMGIITTTTSQIAAVKLLETICQGMDNEISDGSFLMALTENDGTTTMLYDNCYLLRASLWLGQSVEMQNQWLASIEKCLEALQKVWNESGAAFGDPSSPVQDQIYYYLTRSMGLNPAAACGILANIEAESGFNPQNIGDHGTSYGLCQWHEGRYTALVQYCSQRNLDYTTVQGQMEYLRSELESSYANVLASLKSVENTEQGAYDAGYIWCVDFESPEFEAIKGAERGNIAKNTYWPNYNGR